MANQLQAVLMGVLESPTVVASALALVNNVAAQVELSAGNEDASKSLAAMLREHAPTLAQSVLANTPVIAATPPLHPEPELPAVAAEPKVPAAKGDKK